MPFSIPAPRPEEGVIAGVCAGIAQALAVDVTLVRLVFALLALAGGAGILLYLALWAYNAYDRPWWAAVPVVAAGSLLLHSVGLSDRAVIGIALVSAGLAVVWRGGARSLRADAPISYAGVALAAAGAFVLLQGGAPSAPLLAPGAIAGALLLIAGPWVWRLALERDAERAARIRSEERSEMAARVHDSVLQTLALIQRQADDPRRVAAIARRQERELRGWLYGELPLGDEEASLVASLSAAAADVEELHGVRVELASAGDCPVDEPTRALVLAAREAMTNAAKFAGVEEIDVYLETTDEAVAVFVRDRGAGFDRAAVPEDRRGLAESIEGRLERAGGTATVVTAPGAGTEVELRLPRSAP
ncbi:MAG TPA: PspC domain-containing protein [Gaiellaceae bacterium]|jgi:signal transduction histidine kinase|nr:PspC domain-containing protein [Gaiellaceae bacterium]